LLVGFYIKRFLWYVMYHPTLSHKSPHYTTILLLVLYMIRSEIEYFIYQSNRVSIPTVIPIAITITAVSNNISIMSPLPNIITLNLLCVLFAGEQFTIRHVFPTDNLSSNCMASYCKLSFIKSNCSHYKITCLDTIPLFCW
jgi:hypothetical protein